MIMDYQCIMVYTIITILPPDDRRRFEETISALRRPADGCLGVVKRWMKRYIFILGFYRSVCVCASPCCISSIARWSYSCFVLNDRISKFFYASLLLVKKKILEIYKKKPIKFNGFKIFYKKKKIVLFYYIAE